MKQSETIVKIASALLEAQRNIKAAVKDAKNPFFKSKYSTLENVMEACKAQLNEQGISVLQPVGSDEQGSYVETILLHTSGEWVSSRMNLVLTKNDMQNLGSAVSYARRYSLQSLVFLGAEDDDGEASMGRNSSPVALEQASKRSGGFRPTQTKVVVVEAVPEASKNESEAW